MFSQRGETTRDFSFPDIGSGGRKKDLGNPTMRLQMELWKPCYKAEKHEDASVKCQNCI